LSYLIDTNVISELRRKTPNVSVVDWFAKRPSKTLFLSVLTLGELRKGIEKLEELERKTALLDWLEVDVPNFFAGRVLAVDILVADRWGKMTAAAGRPVPAIDSLLAATAAQHGLCLVTRNSKDFECFGLDIINPWNE
jgi:predicted nucleic acid-binding protein